MTELDCAFENNIKQTDELDKLFQSFVTNNKPAEMDELFKTVEPLPPFDKAGYLKVAISKKFNVKPENLKPIGSTKQRDNCLLDTTTNIYYKVNTSKMDPDTNNYACDYLFTNQDPINANTIYLWLQ